MKVIAVDDEKLALNNITSLLKEVQPEALITGFQNPQEACAYLEKNKSDIALLDIEMSGMDGITLAKKCKDTCPDINIIFVTGFSQYAMDAFRLHASGYLMKPVRKKDLLAELENLRHPLPLKTTSKVRIQTFGNFEIFVDNKPLFFPRSKCVECLAYLVDRKGARVSTRELATILWEDKPYDRAVQNSVHRILSDLMKTLKQTGIEDIIIKTHKEIAINIEKVDCDCFRFLAGDVAFVNMFHGEYMSNYSWATFTLAGLDEEKESK